MPQLNVYLNVNFAAWNINIRIYNVNKAAGVMFTHLRVGGLDYSCSTNPIKLILREKNYWYYM